MTVALPWLVIERTNGSCHVVPAGDLRDHEDDMGCWCIPFDDDGFVVHNSLDGREKLEPDYYGSDRRTMQ